MNQWGRRIRRLIWPWSGLAMLAAAVVVGTMLAANGVDTEVTAEDREIVESLNLDDECARTDGFDDEVDCIRAIHDTLRVRFPDTTDAFVRGETGHQAADYVRRGYGSCYDRARLIEQTLRHYGFEVRRVAIYQSQSTPLGYLVPGIDSHALTEVDTSRGWMAVDSIEPMVAVDDEGLVYDITDLREGLVDGTIDDDTFGTPIPDDLFEGDFASVYGVYSRHGYFFEPHLPVPEVNWEQFGWWVVGGGW